MRPVKICGLTRLADVCLAQRLGASLLGVIAVPGTPRYQSPQQAAPLLQQAGKQGVLILHHASLDTIQAYVSAANINTTNSPLLQLHGQETPAEAMALAQATGCQILKRLVWQPQLQVAHFEAYRVVLGNALAGFVLEPPRAVGFQGWLAPEGPWKILKRKILKKLELELPLYLAGGISPETMPQLLAKLADTSLLETAWGFDVSSGVEPPNQPGIKCSQRLSQFFQAL